MKYQLILGAIALAGSLAATAAPLKIDPVQSTVSVVFKQMTVPVEARFKRFAAQLDYDRAQVNNTRAQITIETGSLDLGEAEMNKEVMKKEWFNAAQFPRATFVTSSVKAAGPGKLLVSGTLAIKGKAAQVSFPVTVQANGDRQVFDGSLPISRSAFKIGEGDWSDPAIVADSVTIKFRLATGK